MLSHVNSPLALLDLKCLGIKTTTKLWIKRDDLIHPLVSGNKWRKLQGFFTRLPLPSKDYPIITFGGAYSNHCAAAAYCINQLGHQGIFIIRGDELTPQSSPVLAYCAKLGMRLIFISREHYRKLRQQNWHLTPIQEHQWQLPKTYHLLPEGGQGDFNKLGFDQLWQELISQLPSLIDSQTKHQIWLAAGTGASVQALLKAMPQGCPIQINVISAVKGAHREEQATCLLAQQKGIKLVWQDETIGGGFAKNTKQLQVSNHDFYANTGIKLDPVYNAKVWWHLKHYLQHTPTENFEPDQSNAAIVWINTGGITDTTLLTDTL